MNLLLNVLLAGVDILRMPDLLRHLEGRHTGRGVLFR